MMQTQTNQTSQNVTNMANSPQHNFLFCYNPASLRTIVMLAKHQHIINTILQDAMKIHYFWIYKKTEDARSIISALPSLIQKHSFVFKTISQMRDFLSHQNEIRFQKIVIVYGYHNLNELLLLMRQKLYVKAVLYDLQNKLQSNCKIDNQNLSQIFIETPEYFKICKCKNEAHLKTILNALEKHKLTEQKQFPNFILLNSQVEKSEILSHAIASIVNTEIDQSIRSQILDELTQIVEMLYQYCPHLFFGFNVLITTINMMKIRKVTTKAIIQLYTSEKHKLYALLNMFLRGLNCPTELFYIQPIVKDLYLAIQRLHRISKSSFVCYRGSLIHNNEFDQIRTGVGEFIQNLGFLSTSENFQVAQGFEKNIYYKLTVNDKTSHEGFASISSLSEFFGEEEIVFNPLNYFKVLEAQQKHFGKKFFNFFDRKQSKFFAALEYVDCAKSKDSEDQNRQVVNMLFQISQQIRKLQKFQGFALIYRSNIKNFHQCEAYFNFIRHRGLQKCHKLIKQKCLQESRNAPSTSAPTFSNEEEEEVFYYLYISNLMGNLLLRNGRIEEAMRTLTVSKEICALIFGIHHNLYLQGLEIMSICLWNQTKFKEAKDIVKEFNRLRNMQTNKRIFQQINFSFRIEFFRPDQIREKGFRSILEKYYSHSKFFGPLHPNSLQQLQVIGNLYQHFGMLQRAQRINLKCLKLQKRILGEENMNYLLTLDSLGRIFSRQGKHREALSIFYKYSNALQNALGENNYLYLRSTLQVAQELTNVGRSREALDFFQQIPRKINRILGDNHPLHLMATEKMAHILLLIGHPNKALELYQRIRKLTENDLRFHHVLGGKGRALMKLQRYHEALATFIEYEKIVLNIIGNYHPEYLKVVGDIVQVLICLDDVNKTIEYLGIYEHVQQTVFKKKDNISYLSLLSFKGTFSKKMGQYSQALSFDQQCYDLCTEIYDKNHPNYCKSLSALAMSLCKMGNMSGLALLEDTVRRYGNCQHMPFQLVDSFVALAIFVGQFEKAEQILSTIPRSTVCQKLSYHLKILIRSPKFTNYLSLLKQLVQYKKEEWRKGEEFQKNQLFSIIKSFEDDEKQLSKKKKVEAKLRNKSVNYLCFSAC